MDQLQKDRPSKSSELALPLWIVAMLGILFLLRECSTVFLWLLCSFFLFAILDPWMQKSKNKGYSPVVSAIFLITVSSVVVASVVSVIYFFSGDVVKSFESYRKVVAHLYGSVSETIIQQINSFSHPMTPAASAEISQADVVQHSSPLTGGVAASVAAGVGVALTGLAFTALCPVLTFFIFAERKTLANSFSRLYSDPTAPSRAWAKITGAVRAYFFGNLILAAVSLPIFCILFRIFHVQSPYPLAVAASVFNLVPFLGAFYRALFRQST